MREPTQIVIDLLHYVEEKEREVKKLEKLYMITRDKDLRTDINLKYLDIFKLNYILR